MNRRNSTFRHFQGIPETGTERMDRANRNYRPNSETGAEIRDRQLAEQRAAREEAMRLPDIDEEDRPKAYRPPLGERIKYNLDDIKRSMKKEEISDFEIGQTYNQMEDYVENRFNEISSQIAPGSMTDEEIYAQATREFVQENPEFFNNLSNSESKEFMDNFVYTPEDVENNILTTEEAALKSGMANGLKQISVDRTLATKLGLSEYGAKMINAGIIGALAAAGITLATLLSVGFGGKGLFKRAALGERAQRRAAQGYRKQGKDDMAAKMIAKADRHAQRKIEKAIAAGDTDKANYIKSRLGTDKSNFSFNQLVKRLNYIQFSINYTR